MTAAIQHEEPLNEPRTLNPEGVVYRFLDLRETLDAPRSLGGLAWVPASRCAAEQCDGRRWEYGDGGHRRCAKCHSRWSEERSSTISNPARSSTRNANRVHVRARKPIGRNIEGPLADLADLALILSAPRKLERRAWFLYVAGGYGDDGLPMRGEANAPVWPTESVARAVARYCRWRWSARGWAPNAHEITRLRYEARRRVEKEIAWRGR